MSDSKACTKCGVVKPIGDFYKSKKIKSGYVGMCKLCDSAKGKAYYSANADKVNARVAKNRKANPEKHKADAKAWYEANKERKLGLAAEWRKANPDKIKGYAKEHKKKHPEKVAAQAKARCDKRRATARGKLENVIRAGFHKGITVAAKAGRKTFAILGYTVDELRTHIEKQFLPGMTWDNHGRGEGCWHIDHIIPLSAHNFTTPDDMDFKKAWALSNLRPLWEPDNLRKSDKLVESFQPSFAFGSASDNNSAKTA